MRTIGALVPNKIIRPNSKTTLPCMYTSHKLLCRLKAKTGELLGLSTIHVNIKTKNRK